MLINNSTFYTQNINILKILAPDVETPGALFARWKPTKPLTFLYF